jgi:hypothetical protein
MSTGNSPWAPISIGIWPTTFSTAATTTNVVQTILLNTFATSAMATGAGTYWSGQWPPPPPKEEIISEGLRGYLSSMKSLAKKLDLC